MPRNKHIVKLAAGTKGPSASDGKVDELEQQDDLSEGGKKHARWQEEQRHSTAEHCHEDMEGADQRAQDKHRKEEEKDEFHVETSREKSADEVYRCDYCLADPYTPLKQRRAVYTHRKLVKHRQEAHTRTKRCDTYLAYINPPPRALYACPCCREGSDTRDELDCHLLKEHPEEIGEQIPDFVAVHAYNTLLNSGKASWKEVAASVKLAVEARYACNRLAAITPGSRFGKALTSSESDSEDEERRLALGDKTLSELQAA